MKAKDQALEGKISELKDKVLRANTVQDLERINKQEYASLLRDIYCTTKQDYLKLSQIFSDIAELHIKAGSLGAGPKAYTDAAAASMYSLNIIKDQKLDKNDTWIYDQLTRARDGLLKVIGGKVDLPPITKQNIEVFAEKGILHDLRDYAKERLKIVEAFSKAGKDEDYVSTSKGLFEDIAARMRGYLKTVFEKAQEQMEKPAPCEYALVGLGSMALEQITPYSDLEFAILTEQDDKNRNIKNPDAGPIAQYFKNLTHYANFKVICLGETTIPKDTYNLNLDHLAKPAVSFDLGGKSSLGRPDKVYSLIGTADWLMRYVKNNEVGYSNIDKMLPHILQKPCFVSGDEGLFKEYKAQIESFFLEVNEEGIANYELRAIKLLRDGTQEYNKDQTELQLGMKGYLEQTQFNYQDKQGELLDVKQEIYRLPDRLVYNLGMIYNLDKKNAWEVVETLVENHVLKTSGAKNLEKIISFATILRLTVYSYYECQTDKISLISCSEKNDNKDAIHQLFHLTNEEMNAEDSGIFLYYYSAVPLHDSIKAYCDHSKQLSDAEKNNFFYSEDFFDNSSRISSFVCQRLMRIDKALEYELKHLRTLRDTSDTLSISNTLETVASLYSQSSDWQQAIECFREVLQILQGNKAKGADIARIYHSLGASYHRAGKCNDALSCYEHAINTIGDRDIELLAILLSHKGGAYIKLGEYRKALEPILESNRLLNQLQKNNMNANDTKAFSMIQPMIFIDLSEIYYQIREDNNALSYIQKAMKLFENMDNKWEGVLINFVGSKYEKWGYYKEAASAYEASLISDMKFFGDYGTGQALHNLGIFYHKKLQDLQKAIYCFERNIKMQVEKNLGKAASLCALGGVYIDLAKTELGLKYSYQGLDIYRILPTTNHEYVAQCFSDIGVAHADLKHYKTAIEYTKAALSIQQNLSLVDEIEVAKLKINLSKFYSDIGEDTLSLQLAHETNIDKVSKTHSEVVEERRTQAYKATKFINLATNLLNKTQDKQKTLSPEIFKKNCSIVENFYTEALKIYKALSLTSPIVSTLKVLASLYKGVLQNEEKANRKLSELEEYEEQLVKEQTISLLDQEYLAALDSILQAHSPRSFPQKEPAAIRVASYNIVADFFDDRDKTEDQRHHWHKRAPFVKQLLSELEPDIMCLQELSADQAFELDQYFAASPLKYSSAFLSQTPSELPIGAIACGREVESWKGKVAGTPLIGTFVSHRWKVAEMNRFWLNEKPDEIPTATDRGTTDKGFGNMNTYRAVLWLKLEGDGQPLYVFNSHYPLNGDHNTRFCCARLEMDRVKEITKGLPWISAGDRNLLPKKEGDTGGPEAAYDEFTAAGKDVLKCPEHYGVKTTWLGFTYDHAQNPIKHRSFEDDGALDLIVTNLDILRSFCHPGVISREGALMGINEAIPDWQNQDRHFASDHALLGADLVFAE